MAEIYNITIEQNSTFSLPLTLTTVSASVETPQNLTGYTAYGQVRKHYGGNIVESFHVNNTLNASGSIEFGLAASETLAIPAGDYLYDVLIVTGSVQTRILEGKATVTPYVTSIP